MATNTPIAEFFAKIGVKADIVELVEFTKRLHELKGYAQDLARALKPAFRVKTDLRDVHRMRNSLGATTSQVRALRAEIARLRGTSVNASVNANINRRNTTSGGGGRGGSGGGGRGSVKFGAGAGASMSALMRVGPAGLGGAGAGFFAADAFQTAAAYQGIQSALTAVTGSTEEATRQFKWLQAEADRVGYSFTGMSRQYVNFMAAGKDVGMQQEELQRIFVATTEYGRVLNLSQDDMAGSLRAMQQMLSKTTVTAEELKGQLGERFPGAVGKAARAMNKTVPELLKMMENGQVLAKELLPAMADEFVAASRAGGAFAASSKGAAAQLEKFRNAWDRFKVAFAESGFLEAVIQLLQSTVVLLKATTPAMQALGKAIKLVGEFLEALFNPAVMTTLGLLTAVAAVFVAVKVGFTGMILLTTLLTARLWMMASAVIAATWPFLAIGAAIVAVVAIVEDLYLAVTGKGESTFKKWADGGSTIAKVFLWVAETIGDTIAKFKEFLIWANIMDDTQISPSVLPVTEGIDNYAGSLAGGVLSTATEGTSGRTNYVTVSPTINVNGVTDPKEVARVVDERIGRAVKQAAMDI